MNTIIILKAHPGIQVESLAEIFNTSIRTIYRDFKSLNFAGLPVYSSTGPHGGYYVGEQCFLSPLRFTYEEAASLFLAGSFLLQQKGCPYQKNIHLALLKIENLPPVSRWVKEEIRHSTQKIEELSDGSVIFSAEVSGLIEVKKWILEMGSSAQVLSPQSLRQEIEEEIEGMERRYNC